MNIRQAFNIAEYLVASRRMSQSSFVKVLHNVTLLIAIRDRQWYYYVMLWIHLLNQHKQG